MAFGYPSETAAVFREDLDEIVQSRIFVEWIGEDMRHGQDPHCEMNVHNPYICIYI